MFATVLTGCGGGDAGPKLAKVAGTVKYKGSPVDGATVTMVFEQGTSSGTTDKEGKFTMTTGGREGSPIGKAKQVTVSKVSSGMVPEGNAAPKPEDMGKMMQSMMKGKKGPEGLPKAKNELPEKYNKIGNGLEADIPAGGVADLLYDLKD